MGVFSKRFHWMSLFAMVQTTLLKSGSISCCVWMQTYPESLVAVLTHQTAICRCLCNPSVISIIFFRYYVNRDTLFCYHKASEVFLQQLMALYVSSHYKNSPNDLQLLSDAPAHHVFVLLGPISPDTTSIPDILCVLQICLEGAISRSSVVSSLSRGKRASGDLIPWTLSQQVCCSDLV